MPHGNPVWSCVYRDVITALRDRFRCVALLVSFVDRLNLSGLTLVGHNWGGPFGLYAAQQRPDRTYTPEE